MESVLCTTINGDRKDSVRGQFARRDGEAGMTREEAGTVLELMLATDHTLFSETEKDAIKTAVEMLKDQETVVHPEPSCELTYITDCCCDLCGVQLIREDNFCRCCGKRIEWECR